MSPEPVVHFVDDDAAMRDSVVFLLSSAGLRARAYESAAALLARTKELEPGCVLTDVRMPNMNGLELMRELRVRGVAMPILVLTGHADVALAVEAMKAGAADFLEKPFDGESLLRSLRAALSSSVTLENSRREREAIEARVASLTPREYEVFEAIVLGDSNKSAALRLGISPRTVEIYRANVMTKMAAGTLSDLVRMALARKGAPT